MVLLLNLSISSGFMCRGHYRAFQQQQNILHHIIWTPNTIQPFQPHFFFCCYISCIRVDRERRNAKTKTSCGFSWGFWGTWRTAGNLISAAGSGLPWVSSDSLLSKITSKNDSAGGKCVVVLRRLLSTWERDGNAAPQSIGRQLLSVYMMA